MFAAPSTLQLLLAIVLVLLGVCGNLVLPFISNRSTLRCPHLTMLAALDFAVTLLGPAIMLVIIVVGPSWLEHNKFLCHSLSFLSSWMLISCFLVLLFLALFCQKVQDNVHRRETLRAKRREFVFLALCLFTGLLMGFPPLLGWSSYHGLPFLYSCLLTNTHSISNYSLFYVISSFVALSVTIAVVFWARKHRRLYPLQLCWERHEFETKINDPELTTTASSNATSYHSRSTRRSIFSRAQSRIQSRNQSRNQSRSQSRRSSFRSRSGTILSFNNTESPITSRKSPPQQFGQLECSLLEIILLNSQNEYDKGEGVVNRESLSSSTKSDRKDSRSSSVPSFERLMSPSSSTSTTRDPFVISSKIPQNFHVLLHRKKHFKSPRFLPQFKALQRQLSRLRLLSLRCCVTLLCWLPLYVAVALRLFSVHSPPEFQKFIQWLIFIQSSISPLLPFCETTYRRAVKRAAHSIFKTCTQGNKTSVDLSKTRDVELKIEGIQQVRLSSMEINQL